MLVRDVVRRISWGSFWAAVCLLGLLVTFLYGFGLGLAVGSDVWGGLCR
jgi:hypothetical protein